MVMISLQISKASQMFGYSFKCGNYIISNPCEDHLSFIEGESPVRVRCNMESNGGGWTVLVRRTPDVDERVSFDRTWREYENGFGNLSGEFWYGLKNMHCLTTREPMEVELEVSKTDGTKILMSYGEFVVKGPDASYTLQVSDKHHNGTDFFGYYHTGMKFTTKDRDNDEHGLGTNCAIAHAGGWWHNACYNTHLTHKTQPRLYQKETDTYMLFDYAEMRVRPKTCRQQKQEPPTCS